MMGAALLAARACLRSGVGKLRVRVPAAGDTIMQISVPDAMTLPDADERVLSELPDLEMFTAIGIGPGIGTDSKTASVLKRLLQEAKVPLVIDADALNLLAQNPGFLSLLPPNTILTPHLKEFERLTGKIENDYERLQKLRQFCRQYKCFVVLKGAYSCTCTPSGTCYFNTSGNPGMATGGSGDVLTGIITGLLAQQYTPHEAAVMGVYIHGLAGDFARDQVGTYALTASDIILSLGEAFMQLEEMHQK
ncbi:MAG: NAD(P)H-hydrate dehydratase, partial [Sphingobacteriales bacterium]